MKNKLKVPKIEIELRIMGNNFDPNLISNILSLKATDSWREGEPSKEFNTLKKYDCWAYSISDKESFTNDKLWNEIYDIFNKKKPNSEK